MRVIARVIAGVIAEDFVDLFVYFGTWVASCWVGLWFLFGLILGFIPLTPYPSPTRGEGKNAVMLLALLGCSFL